MRALRIKAFPSVSVVSIAVAFQAYVSRYGLILDERQSVLRSCDVDDKIAIPGLTFVIVAPVGDACPHYRMFARGVSEISASLLARLF